MQNMGSSVPPLQVNCSLVSATCCVERHKLTRSNKTQHQPFGALGFDTHLHVKLVASLVYSCKILPLSRSRHVGKRAGRKAQTKTIPKALHWQEPWHLSEKCLAIWRCQTGPAKAKFPLRYPRVPQCGCVRMLLAMARLRHKCNSLMDSKGSAGHQHGVPNEHPTTLDFRLSL